MQEAVTRRAIKKAGGPTALGRALGLSRQAVEQWVVIPPERCLQVELITGVSRYELRPDVYGRPECDPGRPTGRAERSAQNAA